MKEELDNYFLGNLSIGQKKELLDKVETDEACRDEFIRIQNTVAVSHLIEQKGDKEWANRMKAELDEKIRRQTFRRRLWSISRYAAVILLLIVNGLFIIDRVVSRNEEIQFTTIEVPKGQRVCTTLADGTTVWLSPRSVIKIPDQFNKKDRFVELDGEGFFSVIRNENKPFIVRTEKHQVKVLGTRFNIFAYSQSDRFETDLVEGRVEVSDLNRPEIKLLLNPGEKAYREGDRLLKARSNFNNEDYLKNGIFSFNNKPFAEIVEYLSLWYNVTFSIGEDVHAEQLISGKFRQSNDVISILKALQDVHPFTYKINNEENIEIY